MLERHPDPLASLLPDAGADRRVTRVVCQVPFMLLVDVAARTVRAPRLKQRAAHPSRAPLPASRPHADVTCVLHARVRADRVISERCRVRLHRRRRRRRERRRLTVASMGGRGGPTSPHAGRCPPAPRRRSRTLRCAASRPGSPCDGLSRVIKHTAEGVGCGRRRARRSQIGLVLVRFQSPQRPPRCVPCASESSQDTICARGPCDRTAPYRNSPLRVITSSKVSRLHARRQYINAPLTFLSGPSPVPQRNPRQSPLPSP